MFKSGVSRQRNQVNLSSLSSLNHSWPRPCPLPRPTINRPSRIHASRKMPPQYPGLGLDLRYHGQSVRDRSVYPLGMHTNCHGSNSELLLVREVAMMIVMDTLTDKPDWHRKVFDDKIARKWTDEALAIPSDRFHDEIVQKGLYGNDERDPKRLGTILDGGCLKYVCLGFLLPVSL